MPDAQNKATVSARRARYDFTRCVMEGTDFDNFYEKLQELAVPCDFGPNYDELLVSQIICGVCDEALRQTLCDDGLSLKEVLEKCRQFYSGRKTTDDKDQTSCNEICINGDSHDMLENPEPPNINDDENAMQDESSPHEIISIKSKTTSSKSCNGARAMEVRLRRLDKDTINTVAQVMDGSDSEEKGISKPPKRKRDKILEKCATALREAEAATSNEASTATDSDDSMNMKLIKIKNQTAKTGEKYSRETKKNSPESSHETKKNSPESSGEDDHDYDDDVNGEVTEQTESEENGSASEESDSLSDIFSAVKGPRRSKRNAKKLKAKRREEKNARGSKRKRRGIDNLNVSDSLSDSDDESEVKKSAPRKRNRAVIESDAEEETIQISSVNEEPKKEDPPQPVEEENQESPGKSGRKNIRQIMSASKLEKETKQANLEEKERRKRLKEKSKGGMTDFYTEDEGRKITYTRFCFEKDQHSNDLVIMNEELVGNLKPHQVEGVQFLWDCTVESVERAKTTKGSGAILAHCMGLGKTLQVIAFTHTMLTNEDLPFKTALIIVPANTLLNWVNEFDIWMPSDEQLDVFELTQYKDDKTRCQVVTNWHEKGGVLIIGYHLFRTFINPRKRWAKKHAEKFKKALLNPGPDLVVCDEGHLLKNDTTALSKAVCQISTRRRIVLTGTPLQNNLVEYHCMVDFVKQNLLGTKNEFRNRFVNPITNGQQKDASAMDVKIMKRRSHVLHELLAGCVQRRDYCYITKYLPPKYEYVLSIRLTPRQIKLYNQYLKTFCFEEFNEPNGHSDTSLSGDTDLLMIPKEYQIVRKDGTRSLFRDYQTLARVWTHPYCLKLVPPKEGLSDESEEEEFICDDSDDPQTSKKDKGGHSKKNEEEEESEQESSSNEEDNDPKGEVIKKYKTRTGRGSGEGVRNNRTPPPPEDRTWFSDILQEEDQYDITLSHKLVLLCDILRTCELAGDKILLFSQSLMSLTLIEDTLGMISEAKAQKWKIGETDSQGFKYSVDGTETGVGNWVLNKDYLRLDGGCTSVMRKKMCDQFNSRTNKRCRLFLISTRAGSLGVNLVAANRVIIFDASWNPSHDVQSMFRCYRFGQKKPVFVYRFIAQGSMEEKIYNRQVTKESLSLRVVDENQIDRHFGRDELDDLYQFEPNIYDLENPESNPISAVPKDELLAQLLISRKEILYKYHEHDSLLQHQEDQNLSEEDKKAAWEEYEKEKRGVPLLAQMRQQQVEEQLRNRFPTSSSAPNMNLTTAAYMMHQYQRQMIAEQHAADSKYVEMAVNQMINWASTIGVSGASRNGAVILIRNFMESIRRLNPSVSLRDLGDKIYELFPNYYLGALGVRNPVFSQGNSSSATRDENRSASTGNPVNLGFSVDRMQQSTTGGPTNPTTQIATTPQNPQNQPSTSAPVVTMLSSVSGASNELATSVREVTRDVPTAEEGSQIDGERSTSDAMDLETENGQTSSVNETAKLPQASSDVLSVAAV